MAGDKHQGGLASLAAASRGKSMFLRLLSSAHRCINCCERRGRMTLRPEHMLQSSMVSSLALGPGSPGSRHLGTGQRGSQSIDPENSSFAVPSLQTKKESPVYEIVCSCRLPEIPFRQSRSIRASRSASRHSSSRLQASLTASVSSSMRRRKSSSASSSKSKK